MNNKYPSPVDKLLTFGDCRENIKWPNYLELMGFTQEHIPDLIRVATDEELNWADSESLEVWAPVHAWRALGQLRAEAAIEPLMSLFDQDNDWANDEMPQVYGLIGPAAIPTLKAYLAEKSYGVYERITACSCLEHIGKEHPNSRNKCVAVLNEQLEHFNKNSPTLNGFLISSLLDLQALESAPLIERAFAAKRVDLLIVGDWEDVQVSLGLLSREELWKMQYEASQRPIVDFAAVSSNLKREDKGFALSDRTTQNKSKIKNKKNKKK